MVKKMPERIIADHQAAIGQLLDEQVNPAVAANLQAAGGAAMVWDTVMRRLAITLGVNWESSP